MHKVFISDALKFHDPKAISFELIIIPPEPGNFGDNYFGSARQCVSAHTESVGFEKPRWIGSVKKSPQYAPIIVVMHRDHDLGLNLGNHILGLIRAHGIVAADGQKQNIDISDEIKLVLIERFSDIPRVTDTQAVQFEYECSAANEFERRSYVNRNIIDQYIPEQGVYLVPIAPPGFQPPQNKRISFRQSDIAVVSRLFANRHHMRPHFRHWIAHLAKRVGDDSGAGT